MDKHLNISKGFHSECLDYLIPRMTLQPLFENIFFHAFEDGRGRIELVASAEPEYLELTITDNGKGMNRKPLKSFLSRNIRGKKGEESVFIMWING